MRRRLTIVVTGLALLAALTGCGDTSGSGTGPPLPDGSTAQAIQKKGKLVVGTKFDQPGFGKRSMADTPEGFDIEMAKIVARGIFGENIEGKIEFIEAQSRVREEYVEKGTVDLVVATYSIDETRKQRVSFAGPYLIAGQGLLVKKSDTSITGPDTLAGKKVCTARGSTSIDQIKKIAPQADTSLVFDTYGDCVEALKDGRVEAVTTDDQILLGYASENDTLRVVGRPFSTEKYGIAVKKDDKGFRDWINDQLEKAYKDGTWAKAYADTIGSKTGTPVPATPPVERY